MWYYVVFLEGRVFYESEKDECEIWLCISSGVGALNVLTGFEEKEKPENALFSGFLASPARFERAAFRLGGGPSILLRYGDVLTFMHSCRTMHYILRRRTLYPAELRRGMRSGGDRGGN